MELALRSPLSYIAVMFLKGVIGWILWQGAKM